MEAAIGAASGLISSVVKLLSNELVEAYVASAELGLNSTKVKEHWIGVLENKEWQKQKNDDDIMPSLRISYDYLPFHLKKCFSYFALFPEDYRFKNLEITYFWIAIGIMEKYENYMEELVDNGFLVKETDGLEDQYYILHDLLHELSRSVSSQECLNIYSSGSFRADDIPKTIRHLSITMENKHDGNFRGEMVKLRSKVDIVNLRSLMIFREYGETVEEILKNTLEVIVGLRVLFIVVKSSESFPCYLSKLIHLRFLKISTPYDRPELTLPSTLSRFYHLKLLDLSSWHGSTKFPKDVSRLINLRHFVAGNELHSNVPEVGKMKCLKELTKFCVKKESAGFELSELGVLTELGGKLGIYDLEKVATKEEAMKAKLVSKVDLKELTLVWGESDVLDSRAESCDILDGLEPHPNLQSLAIKNHGGSTGPRWLCGDISIQMLKSLHLEGVSWVSLPPFGQLPHLTSLTLRDIYEVCEIRSGFHGGTDKSFLQLKHIVLDSLPKLIKWVGAPNAHSFSRLEDIRCSSCPNLCTLPFLQECSAVSYNHLLVLEISECPKLFLPPMPHTSTLNRVDVSASPVGSMYYSQYFFILTGYNGALAWENMASKVEIIGFRSGSVIPWAELPNLTSLRKFEIVKEPSFLSMALLSNLPTSLTSLSLIDCENLTVDGFNPLIAAVNLKKLAVYNTGGDGPRSVAADLLSELVTASRTKLLLPAAGCFQLETFRVDCISAVLAAPVCSLFATTLHKLCFCFDQRVESFTEEEEDALQLLNSLQTLDFYCLGLPSLPQGLHHLSSLRTLRVSGCPEIRSLPKGALPASLRKLYLHSCPEIRSLPAEGLPTSLQLLIVRSCSPELQKQAKELKGTKPDLRVYA